MRIPACLSSYEKIVALLRDAVLQIFYSIFLIFKSVFRIRDILVRIRMPTKRGRGKPFIN
jgi:hypothetical protein